MVDNEVDRWVRRYFEHRDSLGPPALKIIMQEGRVYELDCRTCGWRIRDSVNSTEVCYRCRKPWGFEDVVQLRGAFQVSKRPSSAESRFFPWIDLGRVFQTLYRRRGKDSYAVRVYFARCLGHHSLRRIAQEARSRYRRAPFAWNKDNVAGLIRDGRAAIARELEHIV